MMTIYEVVGAYRCTLEMDCWRPEQSLARLKAEAAAAAEIHHNPNHCRAARMAEKCSDFPFPFLSLIFGELVEQRSLMREDVRAKCKLAHQRPACNGSSNLCSETCAV